MHKPKSAVNFNYCWYAEVLMKLEEKTRMLLYQLCCWPYSICFQKLHITTKFLKSIIWF